MSRYSININHIPILGSEEVITREVMEARIRALPIEWTRVKLTDSFYFAPGWDGWRKAIEYLKPKVPKCYKDKFDCENAGGWFRHEMAKVFGINTLAEVEGWALLPLPENPSVKMAQRHGWGLFTDGQFFYQLESQTGVVMDIDDPDYTPDEITMG